MPPIDGLRGAVAVTRRGSVLLAAAEGLADERTGTACTVSTQFQIASISKQFAAAAALLLAEQGVLALDEPVGRWLPGCPAHWSPITLHHLLTHTAGLGHWSDLPGFDVSQPLSPAERIALFQRAPLLTPPGQRWHYSSPGYLLVAHIVAAAGGAPYATFLAEHIFAPLGLTSTTAGSPADAAAGHRDGEPVPSWDLTRMAGTGDIWSTVDDLVRYTAAVHSGALLSAGSLRAQVTTHAPVHDEPAPRDRPVVYDGYGYGVFIGTIAGHPAYFHPGDNPGYLSFCGWLPEQEVALAILTNHDGTDIGHLIRQLLPAALDT